MPAGSQTGLKQCESRQICCRTYDWHRLFNTWMNALGNPAQVGVWWPWQLADEFPALPSRSCCLNWLWTFISSHQSFLLWFSSVSWVKAIQSWEARDAGQLTSLCCWCALYLFHTTALCIHTRWGAPDFLGLMHGLSHWIPQESSWKLPGSRSLRPRDYRVCFFLEPSLSSLCICHPVWGREARRGRFRSSEHRRILSSLS